MVELPILLERPPLSIVEGVDERIKIIKMPCFDPPSPYKCRIFKLNIRLSRA
jgi:hypothetical protein